MKFDLFSLMQKRDESWSLRDVFTDVETSVRLAEQAGFETAWFAEHHFNNYSLCPSPLMAVSYFAGVTSTIRLGTAVVVVPFYQPMRLLQEIGLADVMSNGRLVLGLGSGYQDSEFQRYDVKIETGIERTIEFMEMLELAFTRDEFEYRGKHYNYPPTSLAIKPLQNPMPEIWVAGLMSRPEIQEHVARAGYVPMLTPSWKPMATIVKARDEYRALYDKIGRDSSTMPMGLMRFVHVTNSRKEAEEAAKRARYSSRVSLSLRLNYAEFDGIYAQDIASQNEPSLDEMVENYIIGDAEHCIEKIIEDHDCMGHSHVLFNVQLGGIPNERVLKTIEALGADVIPGVRKELARRGVQEAIIDQRSSSESHAA
jgi:alkanesulfonate monooxygenase SsuD/methylene tetrahydromethanopterin reductase-like flavin-dependent oxidoreductase (luciferase family)